MPGADWVTLLTQGARLVDRGYRLLEKQGAARSAARAQAGGTTQAAPMSSFHQTLHALGIAHGFLDVLEGKRTRRGLFW